MEADAARFIGAGLACFGMAGTALGLGNIFEQLPFGRPAATRRQPTASSAADLRFRRDRSARHPSRC